MKIEWRMQHVGREGNKVLTDRLLAIVSEHPWDTNADGYIDQDHDFNTAVTRYTVHFNSQHFPVADLMEGIDKLTWLLQANNFKGE